MAGVMMPKRRAYIHDMEPKSTEFNPCSLLGNPGVDGLYVIVLVQGIQEGFNFRTLGISQRDRVLGSITKLCRLYRVAKVGQGFADGIQIGGLGEEQDRAVV